MVAFMWEYMKVPEDSREKVKNLLKDANENGVKISHQAPTLYDVVPKEEIAEFEELMRKTIADIVSEASSVACWVYVQKYVKHKNLNEMLQELPDVSQFILAMDALCLAAKRGVDVRIITPGIPDKKFIYNITRSFYHGLVKHGVRVYEWTPGFCHAKMSVADDCMATCGTINLDYRSLYHHFENGCFMADCQAVVEIKNDLIRTMGECRDVTDQYQIGRSAYLRLGQLFMRLFAGLL